MTLPTSLLTLINIQTEFGGSIATSLNEYYRGGAYVPYYQPSTSYGLIPSASTIGMGSFRGVTLATLKYVYILANTQNYVFNTAKVSGYVAGQGCVRLVILPGVVVGSASAGSYALTVDTSWSSSDVVEIINQGYIVGAGGNGGAGAPVNPVAAAGAGASGGPAVLIQRATNFQNTGVVGGGGGGGGGGGYGSFTSNGIVSRYGGAGGSGGAGNNVGTGAIGAPSGASGSLTAGGAATLSSGIGGGSGGAGGSLGVAGSAGSAGVPSVGGDASAGGAGGAAGVAIVGQGNLTNNGSYLPGTVYGARS